MRRTSRSSRATSGALTQFVKREGVGLTIVGPEEPLTNGIVDAFQREGLRIFGPRRDAAELEGSKVFAKELMRQAGIPTADYRIFRSAPDAELYVLSREVSLRRPFQGAIHAPPHLALPDRRRNPGGDRTDHGSARAARAGGPGGNRGSRGERRVFNTAAEARDHVLSRPLGLVLKADGLAAGKGVYVCDNLRQAARGDRPDHGPADLRQGRRPDDPRRTARRPGDEYPRPDRRPDDHPPGIEPGSQAGVRPRRRAEHRRNGSLLPRADRHARSSWSRSSARSSCPSSTPSSAPRRPFRGVIYAGLMLTNQGPKVLEFNVRFGDPECQAVLMRLKSDLFEVLDAVVDERLDTIDLQWDPRPAVTVVMAAEGYPGAYERDRVINNLEEADRMADVKVFHAGTNLRTDPTLGRDGRIVTDGGRVLDVTALGDTLAEAQTRAYEAVRSIRYNGAGTVAISPTRPSKPPRLTRKANPRPQKRESTPLRATRLTFRKQRRPAPSSSRGPGVVR